MPSRYGILAFMFTFRTRIRRWCLGAVALALVVSVAALLLRPMLEREVRARIESAAIRHGAVARIGVVHLGVWPLLRLEGFDLDLRSGVQLHADTMAATWPGHWRLAIRTATIAGPAGVRVSSADTAWDITGVFDEDLRLTLAEPQTGLSIRKLVSPVSSAWSVEAHGLDVGRLFDVRRDAQPLLDGGIADGGVDIQVSADALRFHVDIGARGARFGALADNAADEPQLGDPTDVTLRFDGAWRKSEATVEIPEVHATVAGAALSGSITLRDLDTDPAVDLAFGMQHLDFAQLLGASGLAVPDSLGMAPGAARDLGSATIDVRVRGRLADPASLSVGQKIDFRPPRQMPPGVARLRGDFIFRSEDGAGPAPPHRRLAHVPRLHRTARRTAAVRAYFAAFRRRRLLHTSRHRPARITRRAAHRLVAWRRCARWVNNHPAARKEPVSVARQAARTQAAGISDYVPARVGARQRSDPRDLP